MRIIILVFLIALTISLSSTPWVRRFAFWAGFVDNPQQRKLHTRPMPLLGGLAIIAGAFLAVMLLFMVDLPQLQADSVRGALLASTVVALVGLLDDRYELPPRGKYVGLIIGFAILIFFDIRVKLPLPEIVNYLITFVWVIGISNAINFQDNMDGLSAGLSAVSASFIMLIASINGQFLVSGLAAAVLGGTLGFLRYNFKPAQIFMGDTGALFLGFLLAVMGLQLRFEDNVNFVTWMVPIFILGLPIFDMCLVVFSRLRRGVSPATAGKDHTSHRLVRLGFTQREAVLILYLVAGIFGMVALFITQADVLEGYAVGILSAGLGAAAIWWLDRRPEIRNATNLVPPQQES